MWALTHAVAQDRESPVRMPRTHMLPNPLQTHVARTGAKMEDPAPKTSAVAMCALVLLDSGGWPARPIPRVSCSSNEQILAALEEYVALFKTCHTVGIIGGDCLVLPLSHFAAITPGAQDGLGADYLTTFPLRYQSV